MPTVSHQRAAIPLPASLQINSERLKRMWNLTPAERLAAARRGEFSLAEMLKWAARRPGEVELVNGEFWFITALMADHADD
ncbi:MAG: hypothetical protein M3296_03075 [Actinomycetota bacterium]|nr:hypothetical protein [Actinomycetota bacterium]